MGWGGSRRVCCVKQKLEGAHLEEEGVTGVPSAACKVGKLRPWREEVGLSASQ